LRAGGADRKCTATQILTFATTVPGSPSLSLQFNNAGAFGGITNLTSDGTNLTGARLKSTTSLDWDSGAAAVDVSLFRDAANILALRNGTTADSFRVYNTFTDASNYERGVFDWTTTANTLTIGPQAAGTGTLRGANVVGGQIQLLGTGAAGSGGVVVKGTNQFTHSFLMDAGNFRGVTRLGINNTIQWTGASDVNQSLTSGISEAASTVLAIGNGTFQIALVGCNGAAKPALRPIRRLQVIRRSLPS